MKPCAIFFIFCSLTDRQMDKIFTEKMIIDQKNLLKKNTNFYLKYFYVSAFCIMYAPLESRFGAKYLLENFGFATTPLIINKSIQ